MQAFASRFGGWDLGRESTHAPDLAPSRHERRKLYIGG